MAGIRAHNGGDVSEGRPPPGVHVGVVTDHNQEPTENHWIPLINQKPPREERSNGD